jgi:hypothetical protein
MKRKLLLLFVVVLLMVCRASAQIGGLTSFNYANIPGSARVAALGGNYFAMKDGDVHLAQFNPSLLDSTMHQKVGLSFVDYFDGIAMGYATYAHYAILQLWQTNGTRCVGIRNRAIYGIGLHP